MASSRTTSRTRPMPQANVNIEDLRTSFLHTRSNFTRKTVGVKRAGSSSGPRPDFITFVSLVCEIYRAPDHSFVPIAHYSSLLETTQGQGHTSLVTQASIYLHAPSASALGAIDTYQDSIVIKRPRHSILEEQHEGLISFITDLRVRSHTSLSSHPNIARLRGVGWDFEDEDATIPRPILLEELAPQGALDNFWKNWSFVKLSFKAKLDFCCDIARGLMALHGCGVVHGDVKPENILVFPRSGARNSFLLKLTDFGHSVIEVDGLTALPAFTPQWSAPETTKKMTKAFAELIATDTYSYGLVMLSIMLGRPFHTAIKGSSNDLQQFKQDGSIFEKLVKVIEQEDRDVQESDVEVGTIVLLLRNSVQLDSQARKLGTCLSIIMNYHRQNQVQRNRVTVIGPPMVPVPALETVSQMTIGYHTLRQCSHHLKALIASGLEEIARRPTDPRCAAAAWELVVCYFSGFGVARDYDSASQWLDVAQEQGISAAQDFNQQIKGAIRAGKHAQVRDNAAFGKRQEVYAAQKKEMAGNDTHPSQTSPASRETSTAVYEGTTAQTMNQDIVPSKNPSNSGVAPSSTGPGSQLIKGSDLNFTSRFLRDDEGTDMPPAAMMSVAVKKAVTTPSLENLERLLSLNPESICSVDDAGNTPLLLAIETKQTEVISYLLSRSNITTNEHNQSGRTALHLLAGLEHKDISDFAAKLVAKGADLFHEALPMGKGDSHLLHSLSLRCCPILNAVVHDNIVLLECLLSAAHSQVLNTICPICETGSRFRRILAISLSLLRITAVEALVEHLRLHGRLQSIILADVKVWAGHRLTKLCQVPFGSVAVSAMDLPESFFRALLSGEDYSIVLERTTDFLIATELSEDKSAVHKIVLLLDAACSAGSLDAVRFILGRMAARQDSPLRLNQMIYPMITAMNRGLRDIFDCIVKENEDSMNGEYDVSCSAPCQIHEELPLSVWTRQIKRLTGSSSAQERYYKPGEAHSHRKYLADRFVDSAIQLRHQDSYFISAIMSLSNVECLSQLPLYLSKALHDSNFKVATILLRKSPGALLQVTEAPRLYAPFINFATYGTYPYPDLDYDCDADEDQVVTRILSHGSYRQCVFILKHLLEHTADSIDLLSDGQWSRFLRNTSRRVRPRLRFSDLSTEQEIGVPRWQQQPLDPVHYDALIKGNVMRNQSDRQALWDVIGAQVSLGHSRDMKYLMMAIDSTNMEAVATLIRIGWSVNRHWHDHRASPLRRTSRRWHERSVHLSSAIVPRPSSMQHILALMDIHGVLPPPALIGPRLETHSKVYAAYDAARMAAANGFYNSKMGEVETLLREHGGRASFVEALEDKMKLRSHKVIKRWGTIAHALLYAAVLPITLVYGACGTQDDFSLEQKFGFAYIWALVCYLLPTWSTVRVARDLRKTWARIAWYCMCAVFWTFNNVGLPTVVIARGWRPFRSCASFVTEGGFEERCFDYSFLLPLAAAGLETACLHLAHIIGRVLGIYRVY